MTEEKSSLIDQKTMRTRCPGGFCIKWVPKLLLPPIKIRIIGPKTIKLSPKYAFLVIFFLSLLPPWDKTVEHLKGHHQLSGKSDENKPFKPNQIAPSVYMMIELYYFSLDQWEIKILLL